MKQLTLAHQAEFQRYTKKTRREVFLEEMDAVMPWAELFALIAPHYSKGEVGRKPVGLAIMLRVYFLQQWFALSDPATEDALYESSVLRRFTASIWAARACILAGAQFVVSPALDVRTIELCRRYGVPVLPGALTPTEIVTAWQAGADAVKVFPCSAVGGAKYLKAVKAPLPQIDLIPTGGVSLATAAEFLEAGAFALGVGGDLVDNKAIANGHPEIITENARKYLAIVAQARQK